VGHERSVAQVPRSDFDRKRQGCRRSRIGNQRISWKETPVTRALRSQELWLTLTYLGLLLLMAKGFAS
jgi:hypothetical protein